MIRKKEASEIKERTNPEQWFLEQLRDYTQRQPRGDKTPECPGKEPPNTTSSELALPMTPNLPTVSPFSATSKPSGKRE
jgi:hypothetical protein